MSESIDAQSAMRPSPSSPFQRIWLVDQQENSGPLQATFASFRLDGPLNIQLTERVLREIWRRHEVLRTTVRSNSTRPHL
jgi:hypothetical protein